MKAEELIDGQIYYDKVNKQEVEFGYMGQTGLAIVYEPGDRGGGMQSSWAIDPNNLVEKKPKGKSLPEAIAEKLIRDISSRKGLGDEWEDIDDEIREEIKQTWIELIGKEIRGIKL